MSKTFKGSRIPNKFLSPTVILKEDGAEVKQPGVLKSKSVFFPYAHSNVSISSPLIGWATLSFNMDRVILTVKGFKKKDAKVIDSAFQACSCEV